MATRGKPRAGAPLGEPRSPKQAAHTHPQAGYITTRDERLPAPIPPAETGQELRLDYGRDLLEDNLRSAAARNVRTHLQKLVEEGRVAEASSTYTLTAGWRASE